MSHHPHHDLGPLPVSPPLPEPPAGSPAHRIYLPFPFLIFFGFGVFFAGMLPTLGLVPLGPSVTILPEGVRQIWTASYSVGGLATSLGVLTRRPGVEAAGLALMGMPFAVQSFLSVQALGAPGIPSAVFLAFVALGSMIRFVIILAKARRVERLDVELAPREWG